MLDNISEGDTVIDIGAHKGGYTYWMQKAVGDRGKVIAFEPQAKGAELLRLHFPYATIEQLAVSEKSGEKILYVKPQSYEVSFEASLSPGYPDAVTQPVKTITLDDYCLRRRLRPKFIKIDVEGHEMEVIRGADEILKTVKPYLLIEIEQRHIGQFKTQAIFEHLSTLGYWGSFFWKGSRKPLKDFDHVVHQSFHGNAKGYSNNFMFEPK